MEISVKVIKQGKHTVIALCDLNLLGKTLKFGEINFEICREFYEGSIVSVEKALNLIKQGTAVNMVGPVIVKRAIEEGVVHPKAIIDISGIPHAQIVRV